MVYLKIGNIIERLFFLLQVSVLLIVGKTFTWRNHIAFIFFGEQSFIVILRPELNNNYFIYGRIIITVYGS